MTADLRQAAQDFITLWDKSAPPAYCEEVEALRTALAEPQECKYVREGRSRMFTAACKPDFVRFITKIDTWTFCAHCGKKIKFTESTNEQTS